MNNAINITVRDFVVLIRDERTGAESVDHIVLPRKQLQAATAVGMDNRALIYRAYNRRGYRVLDIVKSVKKTLPVDLYNLNGEIVIEGREPAEAAKEEEGHAEE